MIRQVLAIAGLLVGMVGCADIPPPSLPTRPPVAFLPVELTGVGDVKLGGVSGNTLVLQFTEATPTAILAGPGSLQVTLTDGAGSSDTVGFTGTASLASPGSLGVSATLTRSNVLTVNIVDSDSMNIEPITITGLGISTGPTAALGPINAVIGGCSGSLAGCVASNVLASPGNVVAAQ
jgi:hypothetical protein